MDKGLDKHVLNNGMVILGEPMEHVGSVAFTFVLPCGASQLPHDCCGASSVICEWLFRGAGDLDSRGLVNALDGLGVHRSASVTPTHMVLGATMESGSLSQAGPLYADVILSPLLDTAQFKLSKQLTIQELEGLDDDPRQKVMIALREQFYPDPLGRPAVGKLEQLQALTAERTTQIIRDRFYLPQTIFAIAGKYDFDKVCRQLEGVFDRKTPAVPHELVLGQPGSAYTHHPHDGAQVHIGLMTETVPITNDSYYDVMAAVSVLSGGMSSRLFTEVREKRGLCYAVGARYNTLRDHAGIACYAGTTPEKAQQTADVILAEFDRLGKDITEDEIQRARVGLKSTLIMQSESTSSRAGGIAGDYYLLGRVRSIEEIRGRIERITTASVSAFLKNNPFKQYTAVTIGPEKIKVAR